MASVPPCTPNRIDPRSPPGFEPPAREPIVPEPPETRPPSPDVDNPDRCPEEVPCPDEGLASQLTGGR